MTKKVLLLPIVLLFFVQICTAQHTYCGHQKAMNQLATQYPSFQKAVTKTFAEAQRNRATSRSNEVHQLQVVVHVVHNTDVQNISDELIHEQIAILNEDFQSLNPDQANARDMYKAIAGNAERKLP